jgi:transcriptional regulator of acetoin/glycerol metabolism
MECRHASAGNRQSWEGEERLSRDFLTCGDWRLMNNAGADSVKLGRRQLGMMALAGALASGIYLALDRWILDNGLLAGQIPLAKELKEPERANIFRALDAAKWKVSGENGAGALLGLNASTLSSCMKALSIEKAR